MSSKNSSGNMCVFFKCDILTKHIGKKGCVRLDSFTAGDAGMIITAVMWEARLREKDKCVTIGECAPWR